MPAAGASGVARAAADHARIRDVLRPPVGAAPPEFAASPPSGTLVQRKCACGRCTACETDERLQAKLRIGTADDAYEREADRVAEEVLAAPGDGPAAPRSVQRHASETSTSPLPVPESVAHVLGGTGRPLEPALRRDMEQRFGRDLSNVRVHVDGAAARSAREVDARAYAVGDRIVFGAGEFAPGTESGRRLLAHELTHTLQQSPRAQSAPKGDKAAPGNTSGSLILQRKGGWPDASTKGKAWNDSIAKKVGTIWRIAIAGLKGGTKGPFKNGDSAHTTEAADHRAIVLIPAGFDPDKKPLEVLLYFHGHTEAWRGRYAGYRQRSFEKPTKEMKEAGLVSGDDTVRDVALDQMENQIEQSGHPRMIGILAQGGPQHEFGEINADDYIKDVLERVNAEYPAQLKKIPTSWQVILSGHSGGGFEVSRILSSSSKPANLKAIILFDAEAMSDNIRQRMTDDLKFLADPAKSDADRTAYLAARPHVRVFARSNKGVTLRYAKMYIKLVEQTIGAFTQGLLSQGQKRELDALKVRQACGATSGGTAACKPPTTRERARFAQLTQRESQLQSVDRFLPTVQQLYQVTPIDEATLEHEEIIRGARTGSGNYKPGQGNLEGALKTLP